MNNMAEQAATKKFENAPRVDDATMQVVIDRDLIERQRKITELREKYSLGQEDGSTEKSE